jgi:hypothetical protein
MAESPRLFVGTADGLLMLAESQGVWRELGRALAGHPVRAVTALSAEALLVAAEGLPPQQSFDGGASWTDAPGATVEPPGLRAVTLRGPVPLANPRLMGATAYARLGGRHQMLVGAGAGGMLLFRSDDDGIHWEPAAMPGGVGLVRAIIPAAGGVLWAGTDSGRLLRSTDQGASWHEVASLGAPILCLAAV